MGIHKCEICNFSSKQKNDLNRHRKTKKHLNNVKQYEATNKKISTKPLKKPLIPSFHLKNPPNFQTIKIRHFSIVNIVVRNLHVQII